MPKPKAAFFPLGGDATAKDRQRCDYSMRVKLDRDGAYEVIDGPMMDDLAAEAGEPISFDTPAEKVRELGKLVEASVLVWGELNQGGKELKLRLKILDLRDADPKPRTIQKTISAPTDVRFVSEAVLETLPGVKTFEHPSETSVQHDALAEELWKRNPNLVENGDFSKQRRLGGQLPAGAVRGPDQRHAAGRGQGQHLSPSAGRRQNRAVQQRSGDETVARLR